MLDEIADEIFPRKARLRDGREITLRIQCPEDERPLYCFFQQIPREDRLFLRDDVTDPAVIGRWCRTPDLDHMVPLIGEIGGATVALATLHRDKLGWTSHIGMVRIVVHPAYRRLGIASLLIREISEIALHACLSRLNAECTVEQTQAIATFRNAGFSRLAVIPGQVHDLDGQPHDLVLLGCDLREDQELFSGLD